MGNSKRVVLTITTLGRGEVEMDISSFILSQSNWTIEANSSMIEFRYNERKRQKTLILDREMMENLYAKQGLIMRFLGFCNETTVPTLFVPNAIIVGKEDSFLEEEEGARLGLVIERLNNGRFNVGFAPKPKLKGTRFHRLDLTEDAIDCLISASCQVLEGIYRQSEEISWSMTGELIDPDHLFALTPYWCEIFKSSTEQIVIKRDDYGFWSDVLERLSVFELAKTGVLEGTLGEKDFIRSVRISVTSPDRATLRMFEAREDGTDVSTLEGSFDFYSGIEKLLDSFWASYLDEDDEAFELLPDDEDDDGDDDQTSA